MQVPKRSTVHELISMPGAGILTCGHWQTRGFSFVWHQHPQLELTLIVRGEGTRHVADHVADFQALDTCLLGPGVPHTWHSRPGSGPSESVCIQFDADALLRAGAHLPELAGLGRLIAQSRRGLQIEGALQRQVADLILALDEETSALARLAQLLRVLALLKDGSQCRALSSEAFICPEQDPALARLTRFVQEHRHQPLSQRRMAEVAGVSVAGFSRYFKSKFKRTWRSYLVELRIADACRRLAESEDTVMAVGMACGFSNLSNFNRRFRQVKGMVPSAWRRAARGG